jgi:trans-2,3-dihydro-3-hydroxyanthranilate isomerase
VPTKAFNQAVKHNSDRFPGDFRFRLTRTETDALNRSQIATGSLLSCPLHPKASRVLPPTGTDAVFAYVRGNVPGDQDARNYAPLDATVEDPATGSATAATIALLATLRPERDAEVAWRVEQEIDMGRPSLPLGRTEKRDGLVTAVYVAGHAVPVMSGLLHLPPQFL